MGPFRLLDLIGSILIFFGNPPSIVESNFIMIVNSDHSRIQQQKVDAGHHGKKKRQRFYDYN